MDGLTGLGGMGGGLMKTVVSFGCELAACSTNVSSVITLRVGVDRSESSRRLLGREGIVTSSRNLVEDWLNRPSSSNVSTSSSDCCSLDVKAFCLSTLLYSGEVSPSTLLLSICPILFRAFWLCLSVDLMTGSSFYRLLPSVTNQAGFSKNFPAMFTAN